MFGLINDLTGVKKRGLVLLQPTLFLLVR